MTDEYELAPRLHHLGMLLRRTDGRRNHHHYQGQGRVLTLLGLRSPISQKDLGYLLDVRPQSLGELLGKLEAAELIVRTADPDDGRARMVELTDAGRAAAAELADQPRIDPLAVLGDEDRQAFITNLDRIIAGLEERAGELPDDERRGRGRGRGRDRGHDRGRRGRPDFDAEMPPWRGRHHHASPDSESETDER